MLVSVPAHLGYSALMGLVFAESAGLPVPGETALIAAGLLAGSGALSLPVVITAASVAAILGDNLGYLLGRRGGRALLLRKGRFSRHRRRAVATGDRFFVRHGPKTIFLGRWITGVRVVAAVMAGAANMPWRTFLLYNTLGAVTWAATIASVAALLGPVIVGVVYGVGVGIMGGGAILAGTRAWWLRRRNDAGTAPTVPAADPVSTPTR